MTVVIATWNWSEVLPYSIASVLEQTFTDLELLVVGDGCTDNSGDVVARFADPRVAWVNLPVATGHQSGPNNEAIRRSRSDLVAYLGHDDLWLPEHLAGLVAAVGDRPGVAYASTLVVEGAPGPYAHPRSSCSYQDGTWLRTYPQQPWTYAAGAWVPPTSLLHSRELVRSAGRWRPPSETGLLTSEGDLVARLVAASGRPPVWVPRVSCVKLPASGRPDVYLQRPHHEQAAWLARIRAGQRWDSLQAPLAARPNLLQRARRDVGRQSWKRRLRRVSPTEAPPPAPAEQLWREQRRYKGLDPRE